MPTEEEIQEIEQSANDLLDLIKIIEGQKNEMMSLHKANAALWANISEEHKQRADWYFGFIKEAKEWIGQCVMLIDHAELPHHLVVFHNKLAKLVEIVNAENKK